MIVVAVVNFEHAVSTSDIQRIQLVNTLGRERRASAHNDREAAKTRLPWPTQVTSTSLQLTYDQQIATLQFSFVSSGQLDPYAQYQDYIMRHS